MIRLGLAAATLLIAGCSTMNAHEPDHLIGLWGGAHAGLEFDGGLGEAQFDCASGTIDEVVRPLGAEGIFSVKGTYREGVTGPIKVGQIYRAQEAKYAGTIARTTGPDGKSQSRVMTLNVVLEDGTKAGPYTLKEGMPAEITRCR